MGGVQGVRMGIYYIFRMFCIFIVYIFINSSKQGYACEIGVHTIGYISAVYI